MDEKESNANRKDLIKTPTNTDENATAETSKRKHQHDEADDTSDENTDTRQVKKIRLVVSTKQDKHGSEEVGPVIVLPAAVQQRISTGLEESQPNEEDSRQIDVGELEQTVSPTPSDCNDAEAKNLNNLELLPLEQSVKPSSPDKENIPEDISELFASITPVEFVSPPEPLFPDLDLNFSPSSSDLIDALFQSVGKVQDESHTISTGAASPTHDTVVPSEANASSPQVVKEKESSPEAKSVLEADDHLVAPTETDIPSTDTESKASTNESVVKQVGKKRQALHDDEHDQSSSTQTESTEERIIKKMRVTLQEPLSSEPSSSKSLNKVKDEKTSQPSTPPSRKGKEKATTITDDGEEEPAHDSDVEQQEHVSFDGQDYEDLLLEQELQHQSRSDRKRYLMQQESLLVYYKSISQGSSSDSSSSESSGSEASNNPKKSDSEESSNDEQKNSSSESPPSPSPPSVTSNEPSASDNINDEVPVKSPPSNSEPSPNEILSTNTTPDTSTLVEISSPPINDAAPAFELTSPNGTRSTISLLSPIDENNDEAPPSKRVPLSPFKNLAIRKTTPDGQRSYITEFICITNNDITPVSIASTNNDIINRNEVPDPEPFTIQELKLPPRAKLRLIVNAPTPTTPSVEPSGGPKSSSTPPAATRKRKQLMPSLKQQEINLRKERERLKPSQDIHRRLRGSNLENSQSTSASGTTESNPAPTATTQSTNTTGDTSSDEANANTAAAGQQRNSNKKTKKLLTLDDILNNMHR